MLLIRIATVVQSLTLICGCSLDYASFDDGQNGGAGNAESNGGTGNIGAGVQGGDGAGDASNGGAGNAGNFGGAGNAGGVSNGGQGGTPIPECGDGVITPDEQCDHGGTPNMYCDASCNVICSGTYLVKDPATHTCYYDTVADGLHLSWQEGRVWCQTNFGGDLAVISSPQELSFLQGLAPNQYSEDRWVGANDFAAEGTFVWINNEPFTYDSNTPPWASGEPSGAQNDDCVVMEADGDLAEVACNQTFTHHFCERAPQGS